MFLIQFETWEPDFRPLIWPRKYQTSVKKIYIKLVKANSFEEACNKIKLHWHNPSNFENLTIG